MDELFLLSRRVGLGRGFSSLCSARRIVEIWDREVCPEFRLRCCLSRFVLEETSKCVNSSEGRQLLSDCGQGFQMWRLNEWLGSHSSHQVVLTVLIQYMSQDLNTLSLKKNSALTRGMYHLYGDVTSKSVRARDSIPNIDFDKYDHFRYHFLYESKFYPDYPTILDSCWLILYLTSSFLLVAVVLWLTSFWNQCVYIA